MKTTNYKELANDLARAAMGHPDVARSDALRILMGEIDRLNETNVVLLVPDGYGQNDGVSITKNQYDEMRCQTNKITIIKLIRAATGIGLKEAKLTSEVVSNFPNAEWHKRT